MTATEHWAAADDQDPLIGTASIRAPRGDDWQWEVGMFSGSGARGTLRFNSRELAARFLERAGFRRLTT